ncbi:MAG: pirin family protein [Rhodocyclaceae bacterium]|nr:pirin family protein [Rhodocyclaceae bacterium]
MSSMMHTDTPLALRAVERVVIGREVMEGAGVRITRVLTQDLQHRLDPFLMLDVFRSDDPDDYGAGFPSHPHRGFETVTFMIDGRMRHTDSAGHEGLVENGGVQWMTAGRGVIHSEMPEQKNGMMEGFQLWLNLPASDKMCAPWYRDFGSGDLPKFTTDQGVNVTVIAGQVGSTKGAVQRAGTAPLFLDLEFPAGATFALPLTAEFNAFAVAYRGSVGAGDTLLGQRQMAIFANQGAAIELKANEPSRAILLAGRPLNEPIAQHGPFVMNTTAQLYEAVADFNAGRLGEH